MNEEIKQFIGSMEGSTYAERRANAIAVMLYKLIMTKDTPKPKARKPKEVK